MRQSRIYKLSYESTALKNTFIRYLQYIHCFYLYSVTVPTVPKSFADNLKIVLLIFIGTFHDFNYISNFHKDPYFLTFQLSLYFRCRFYLSFFTFLIRFCAISFSLPSPSSFLSPSSVWSVCCFSLALFRGYTGGKNYLAWGQRNVFYTSIISQVLAPVTCPSVLSTLAKKHLLGIHLRALLKACNN